MIFKIEQNKFLNENSDFFEDAEENKFEYTQVFEEYQSLIESILFDKITKVHPDFDAELFVNKLQALDKNGQFKEQELSDIMLSFTDFQIFKNLVL